MNREELIRQIRQKKSFLCVGLDTDPKKMPQCVFDLHDPIFEFNKAIIDATASYCVAYKPNLAFYEAYGLKGLEAFVKTCKYLKETHPHHLIIADAKRGDIGNTSQMYARTFFDEYDVDALTVAPYMGEDSVTPFLQYEGKWVVLLALTSNKGSNDFQLMQDENGDGLPNDTWYELKGSDTFAETTIHDYSVTYYRPSSPGMSVQWTDNQGGSGKVNYITAYHHQDWYYPLWVKEDRYTLRGTMLEAHNYDKSGKGTYWVNPPYGWGYVDNFNETDMLGSKDTNHFKISDAVRYDGSPANLKYIDFVKVQNALNASSGWLGEVSTEVCGIFDYNLKK